MGLVTVSGTWWMPRLVCPGTAVGLAHIVIGNRESRGRLEFLGPREIRYFPPQANLSSNPVIRFLSAKDT